MNNIGALLLMGMVGIFVPLFVSISLLDMNNKKLEKTIITGMVIWFIFWCGPPLFKLWTVGVLG